MLAHSNMTIPRDLWMIYLRIPTRRFVLVGVRCLLLSAVSSLSAEEQVDYLKQIKPLLTERCVACHGVLKQEAGLRLDTATLAIQGGESGAVIKPGEATASLLLKRVTTTEESERMPPEGEPLKPEQIAALRNWINQQAQAPAHEQPERHPRDHWSFKTPVRPAVPDLPSQTDSFKPQIANPIDVFITSAQRSRGIVPQAEADRRIWLRRVSLDLIGLPPTPAELEAFLADDSSEADDNVVTRLLESPQYGQRWGRHWMDIWRYSDWWGLGSEVRNSQKHIWHWRDWIVESINSDKGYDQMLREMLAADELYPNDLDRMRATGYLARQYFIFNRTSWLDETIEHTAKAMLGLTFNCAKCHDHKYDPFSQVEYYKIRAIFEPYQIRTEMISGQLDLEKDGIPHAFDAHLDLPTHLHVRGDESNPDKSRIMEPAVPAFLSSDALKLTIEPVLLPPEATSPGLRDFVIKMHRQAAEQQIAAARSAVEAAQKTLLESAAQELAAKDTALKAAAQGDAKSADNKPTSLPNELFVRDDFLVPNPELWEPQTGHWSYANGHLIQSQIGANRDAVRLKQLPPHDFEARLKYIPTGGEMWKSVGISCDVTAAGNELLAYVSSVAGASKSQIAFKQDSHYVYPPTAQQSRNVELNQPHEIVLRIRGTLLNMSVDGEHSIAYQLPAGLERQHGYLELIAFDAQVELLAFELRALPAELQLVEAAHSQTPPVATVTLTRVDELRLAVTIAQKVQTTAEAQLACIEARVAADRARHLGSESSRTTDLALAAGRSERVLAAAGADEELRRAELAVAQATADKKADADKKLDTAKATFETSQKAIDVPNEVYTSLSGAKKTQEDYQNRNAGKPFPATSSGRRSAFAKWLTDPRQPLTARVAVNHIWIRHMGKALVPTVFDFGRKGAPPTHPELLDWLATELIEHNWSMKHIHRLIVTSHVYRLSSSSAGATDATLAADPENRFYWRMNPVRMESQIVRDSLLHLAGELDLSLGGPSMATNDESARRRSLYFVHSHNDHQPFLAAFDDASVLDCYRRAESIVPQQALAMENSSLATALADKIAQHMAEARPNAADSDFIRKAFLSILSVEPTANELATMSEILNRMTDLARAKKRPNPEGFARTNLVHTLLNHNDFITIR